MNESIALLGLGTMSAGMAANLLKAGFSLTVYNRTAAKAQALVSAGARLALTPAEAAKGVSIVIGMLTDDATSRDVWSAYIPGGRQRSGSPDSYACTKSNE